MLLNLCQIPLSKWIPLLPVFRPLLHWPWMAPIREWDTRRKPCQESESLKIHPSPFPDKEGERKSRGNKKLNKSICKTFLGHWCHPSNLSPSEHRVLGNRKLWGLDGPGQPGLDERDHPKEDAKRVGLYRWDQNFTARLKRHHPRLGCQTVGKWMLAKLGF